MIGQPISFRPLICPFKQLPSLSTTQASMRGEVADNLVKNVHRRLPSLAKENAPEPLDRSTSVSSIRRSAIRSARSSFVTDREPIEYELAPPVSRAEIAASICARRFAGSMQ